MASPATSAPYCGSAPLPGDIWQRWNGDPLLLLLFAAALVTGAAWLGGDRRSKLAWNGGLAALLIAFVSPLCALSSGLFAARSAHHLLVVALAAPLLGFALAGRCGRLPVALLAAAHILAFWAWHVPGLYAAALANDLFYWLMQTTLLGTGLLFWAALYKGGRAVAEIAALLAMIVQMGLLGAIITFAPTAMYAPHFDTAHLYGVTPLADQQVAGLIMWVGSLPLTLAAGAPLLLRRLSARWAPA